MNKCSKCGFLVKDGAKFCKKCGTVIESKIDNEIDEGLVIEGLKKYSLEMREISDNMISTYSAAVEELKQKSKNSEIEAIKDKLKEYQDKEKAYIREIENLKEKINESTSYNNELLGKIAELKLKISEGKIEEYCPNCGEKIEEGMMYCGSCGTKKR